MNCHLSRNHKIAAISLVHNRFCAESFIQFTNEISEDWDWGEVCRHLEQNTVDFPKGIDWKRVHRVWESLSRSLEQGVSLTCAVDKDFPQKLIFSLQKMPALLSYKGNPIWNTLNGVAVVGARKMHSCSEHWMQKELLPFLSGSNGIYLISGGAYGVDQLSHRLAIRSGIPTVVVLPSGLESPYPQKARDLMEYIGESGGALLSPFSYDQKVRPSLFARRNQLLVSLSEELLLVQAARRSGSHMSALMALSESVEVGVVPGHPSEADFSANLDLIYDGAKIIRDRNDLETMIFENGKTRLCRQ